MKIELAYDRDVVGFEIPEANVEQVIRPWKQEAPTENHVLLRESLSVGEVEDFARIAAEKRVCVLLDDGTRDEPFEDIFPEVFPLLLAASAIQFVICTGTHNPDTPGNRKICNLIEQNARHVGIESYAIHTHDCQHDTWRCAGTTSYGCLLYTSDAADE